MLISPWIWSPIYSKSLSDSGCHWQWRPPCHWSYEWAGHRWSDNYPMMGKDQPFLLYWHICGQQSMRIIIITGAISNIRHHRKTSWCNDCNDISISETGRWFLCSNCSWWERDNTLCHFQGLVIKDLDIWILGGVPFMQRNDISTNLKFRSGTPSSPTDP